MSMDRDWIRNSLEESGRVLARTAEECGGDIEAFGRMVVECLDSGHKMLLCGNGGSAADAQHLAAEMTVKMCKVREPMAAIALTTNSSLLTAQANDLGFDTVFARQIDSLANPGDILVAISTSGDSPNILQAVEAARRVGIKVVGLTGKGGGKLAPMCDLAVVIPSDEVPRIQEAHIAVGHLVCEHAEAALNP
jgi:D-sedoheptulose 7-phosphate isomerase